MWHWMKSYFFGFAEMFPCDLSYSECVSPSLVKAALAQSDPESCILQEYKKCILFKTGSSYSNLHFQTISILFFFFVQMFLSGSYCRIVCYSEIFSPIILNIFFLNLILPTPEIELKF